MGDTHTLLEIREGIAEITLNRPDRLNAWTPQMGNELIQHLTQLDTDDSVRAIIVTGAGRAFCAGADLARGDKAFEGGPESAGFQTVQPVQPWDVRKPIIAAMNGHAVGVGLTLALQYDLRVVAADAKLQFAFIQRGIVPELASTYIVPRLIGMARASDLMLSGRIFRGQEAADLGLANEALAAEDVLPRAREMAAYIRDHAAPVSVALTKRMLWNHLNIDDPDIASRAESRALAQVGGSPDAREGVQAFLEKRSPVWTMGASEAPEV